MHLKFAEPSPVFFRDRLFVLSYPGPDRSVGIEDLRTGRAVSRRYRNRRIGEFLKELNLAKAAPRASPRF